MKKDPYRVSAYIYDLFVSSPNSTLKRRRLQIAPALPGMRVLDVGCGTGSDLQLYARAGCRVHGVDPSATMLRVARKRLGELAELQMCSGAQLPYRSDSFDLVLASLTLHEMPAEIRSAVVEEIVRVVRPDGRILLTDFLTGPYAFPIGWGVAIVRNMYERAAGREHFHNGRDFLRRGGLQELVDNSSLNVEQRYVPKTGTVALYLLRKAEP